MSRFGKLWGRKSDEETQPKRTVQLGRETTDMGETAYGIRLSVEGGHSRLFTQLPIRIGRDEKNDFVLSDESVSAEHAVIEYDPHLKAICIRDLDSLNGVYVQNLLTRKNVLVNGAQLRLGRVTITFQDTGYIPPP